MNFAKENEMNITGATMLGFPDQPCNYSGGNKPASTPTIGTSLGDSLSESVKSISAIALRYDVRSITPRDMAKMSQELYDSGAISLKNHAFISFQPELNPSYNTTIGRFTNTTAHPDIPRNFLDEWNDRLAEQLKNGASDEIINNTRQVLSILDNLNVLRKTMLSRKDSVLCKQLQV